MYLVAVSLYRAYHGTPQTCGGMKNAPNTFLDVTCDKVTAKGRGARRRWLWYHAYHGWPYGLTVHPLSAAVHTLHTAGQERGGAWRAKYHAYHDTFPDVIVKLPRHQLPWVGTIGAAPLPPSETLKKYHAYLVCTHLQQKTCPTYIPPLDNMYKAQVTVYYIYHGCWGADMGGRNTACTSPFPINLHCIGMCGGDTVPPSAGTLGGARTMGTMFFEVNWDTLEPITVQ
ncbi:hypothetical protein C8J57DRAFT_1221511 [Mycena rebaudengoi]|nr:hypothetical protein C8J57DRAFT_1221511 [Mycena rebaudengoi]